MSNFSAKSDSGINIPVTAKQPAGAQQQQQQQQQQPVPAPPVIPSSKRNVLVKPFGSVG